MNKTKIILQCLLIIIIPILTARGEQLTKSIHSNQYFIKDLDGGTQIINMSDFGRLTQKGYPALPSKTFFIQLPHGARVRHIDIIPGSSHIIPGHYNLKSADILFPLDSNEKQISQIIQDHLIKKKVIYSKNKFYPESIAEILNPDLTDNNVVIRIRYTPIQYNPVEKSLKIVDKINVRVDYSS
ncbi:MAG: C25 family peptidase propeptide domain-containing protein, partial [bacterium]